MKRGVDCDPRACSASPARQWILAVVIVAGILAGTVSAHAASLQLSWNAPTTNADGTPLTDLAGYRIYIATAQPPCPGASFHTVPSPGSAPAPGETVSHRIAALSAGATYVLRVTAVDHTGNESACSASASGVAQPDLGVTPSATTDFGSVTTGSTVDRSFAVQNTTTTGISGTVSVGAPFSVVSGGSFSLAAGASQAVTVRFRPTTAGTFAGNVAFTAGGDTVSRVVTGVATAGAGVLLSVTKNGTGAGTVTSSPAGIACGTDCTETAAPGTQFTLAAAASSGSTFAGWSGPCTGTAACVVTLSAATTVVATFNASSTPAPVPVAGSLAPATAAAGSPGFTLTVNGSGFVAASVVRWNGAARATTLVGPTQLRAAIAAADVAAAGSAPVTVFTPAPGGGTSAPLTFSITALAAPLPPPDGLSVRQLRANSSGVAFVVRWSAVSGATAYRYVAGFNDGGAAQQGTVTSALWFQLRMPYHASGAPFGGFVCLRSVNAAGRQSAEQSCAPVAVPGR